jgi:hypothetical protein
MQKVMQPNASITFPLPTLEELSDEIDWTGNTCLHNLFARTDVDLVVLKNILNHYPQLAQISNPCGRIPLHYAVDHGKVQVEALQLLVQFFPEGILVKDNSNLTPFELTKRWDHPRSVQWLFLSRYPELDPELHRKLKYGPLGSLANIWEKVRDPVFLRTGTSQTSDLNDESESNMAEEDPSVMMNNLSAQSQDDDEDEAEDDAAGATPLKQPSISNDEVTEFEGLLNSGSTTGRKSFNRPPMSSPLLSAPSQTPSIFASVNMIQESPASTVGSRKHRFSIASVQSFDNSFDNDNDDD